MPLTTNAARVSGGRHHPLPQSSSQPLSLSKHFHSLVKEEESSYRFKYCKVIDKSEDAVRVIEEYFQEANKGSGQGYTD